MYGRINNKKGGYELEGENKGKNRTKTRVL